MSEPEVEMGAPEPVCNCNVRGGYLKGHGPDPAFCPVHGDRAEGDA